MVKYVSSNITKREICINGKYPLYDANGEIGMCDAKPMEFDFISVIKDGAGVARLRILEKNSCILGTMGGIIPLSNNNLYFFICFFGKI